MLSHSLVLAPVSSVAEAARAVRDGAELVDAGDDDALRLALREEGIDVLVRDLVCEGPEIAELAVRRGTARDLLIVQVGPGEVEASVAAGWRTLVDVDTASADPAAAGAIATVCAWQGAHLIRTRHVTEVRRCLDMTESILGIRPPAWAVRGLG